MKGRSQGSAGFGAGSADGPGVGGRKRLPSRRRSLSANPEQEALLLVKAGRLPEAEAIYRALLKAGPPTATACNNLALLCGMTGRKMEELRLLRQALTLQPHYPPALANLGKALLPLGRLEESERLLRQALELATQSPEILNSLGATLMARSDLDGAEACFREALHFHDELAEAHFNLARTLLLRGRFQEAWQRYEWRWRCPEYQHQQLTSGRPPFAPEARTGRLLLWPEQGVGDEVLFHSLLHEADQLSEEIVLQADDRLLPLLERSFPALTVVGSAAPVPESRYDRQLPVGGMCRVLRPDAGAFRRQRPGYLRSDPIRRERIREELQSRHQGLLCGVSWHSAGLTGPAKSIELAALAPALSHPDVALVSLQYGSVRQDIARLRRKTGVEVLEVDSVDTFGDLDGLAALIDACDLVVSISNSTANLAGALGKPTWVLLPSAPDWRWGQSGASCFWYPSCGLFRQERPGDWQPPLFELGKALDRLRSTAA